MSIDRRWIVLSTVAPSLLLVTFSDLMRSQVEASRKPVDNAPTVFFETITFASDQKGKSRLEMYVQMPYEEIRFVKEGEEYVGRYDIGVDIYTPSQNLVWQRNILVEVRTKDFGQTVSNRLYSLKQISTDVEPGNYDLRLQVRDEDSKTSAVVKRSLLVTDYWKDPLSLSDLMLVSRLTTSGDKKSIVPNISGNIPNTVEGFFLFCELYAPPKVDSAVLAYKVLNGNKEEVFRRSTAEALTGQKTQVFLKVDSINLPMGSYLVTVDASTKTRDSANASLQATTSRTFFVRWADLPFSITDLDKAIDQMRYIAKDNEIDNLRDGKTIEEKKRRFIAFWSKRNPDPSSPRNSLMEEYYQRVDYSNKTFSHYMEGWKTDMGMIYIRFGPPENVERHPFETGSRPYEIWYYYQLQREFVFVDETGFGDYRLKYPTTDLWGRVR